jgi:hypothetical protein
MAELSKPIEVILKTISESKPFRNDVSNAAPDIVDKIYSYYTNPNCTCKSAIVEWVNKNVDIVNKLVETHTQVIESVAAELSKAAHITAEAAKNNQEQNQPPYDPSAILKNPKSKFGHMEIIDRSPIAYKELIEKAFTEQWMYRGCGISADVVDGKSVWMLSLIHI